MEVVRPIAAYIRSLSSIYQNHRGDESEQNERFSNENPFILVDVRLINLKGPPFHRDDDLIIDVCRASALGKSGW